MLQYDYGCVSKDPTQKNKVATFTLRDLGISIKDPIPEKIEKDGEVWVKLINTTSRFTKESDPTKDVFVNSLEYFVEIGELPLKEVWVNGEKYLFDRVITGVPNFADFTDTFRRMHDDSYKIKFTKPPLQCESKTWGYGLT